MHRPPFRLPPLLSVHVLRCPSFIQSGSGGKLLKSQRHASRQDAQATWIAHAVVLQMSSPKRSRITRIERRYGSCVPTFRLFDPYPGGTRILDTQMSRIKTSAAPSHQRLVTSLNYGPTTSALELVSGRCLLNQYIGLYPPQYSTAQGALGRAPPV